MVQSFEINQGEELVELEQELNENGYDGFKFNMDDFFGDTPPHLNNSLAHRNVPYLIGINDSEMGFLLPGFIQLGDPKTPRDVLIGQLIQFISLSNPPRIQGMMTEEMVNQAANHAMEVIEGIYGGENCPFKPEDAEYSRYCYLKSMADQWFMGGFLRAEENCESRLWSVIYDDLGTLVSNRTRSSFTHIYRC